MRVGWIVAVIVLLLPGCVGIPSSGPVEEGLPGPVPEAADPLVRPIANPPRPGMAPLEVVEGFLSAAASVGDDYRVAREYLTPEAAREWDPGAGVVVTDDEGPELTQASGAVTATFLQQAGISSSGVLQPLQSTPGTLPYPMSSIEGEWRIAEAPAGLLLTQRQLDRAFAVRNAYFLDPTRTIAVPDVRLLPLTNAEALATALVSALLAGPSDWLAPGVASAIPEGMELALGAVPVVDGVASVDLQGPAVAAEAAALEQFGAQLAWTLRQVPGVDWMEVTQDGRTVPLPDQRGPVPLTDFDSYNPDVTEDAPTLFGLTPEGRFAAVAGEEVRELDIDYPAGQRAQSVAVGPRGLLLAGAAADGSGLLLGAVEGGPATLLEVPVAAGPRLDAQGRLWWTDGDARVRVADGRSGAAVSAVAVEDLGGPVRAVHPSRDGTRVVLLVGDGPDRVLWLGVVVPGPGGIAIRGLRTLSVPAVPTDVAWRDADELTVLEAGPGLVQRFDLLGSVGASFAVADAVTLTDAPASVVVLGLAAGPAGRATGDGVRIVAGLTAPAYPG